jgi:hypothetical protein
MEQLFVTFACLNAFCIILLFVYYPMVWLNLIYTFEKVSASDIQFYSTDLSCFVGSCFFYSPSRYQWMWWELATDVFLLAIPILPLYNMLLIMIYEQKSIFWSYTFPLSLVTALEIIKFFKTLAGFSFCNEIQFCRNYDSALDENDAYKPNYVYLMYAIFTFVFVVLCVIYLGLAQWMLEHIYENKKRAV